MNLKELAEEMYLEVYKFPYTGSKNPDAIAFKYYSYLEKALQTVRNETIDECGMMAETHQLPQGKMIPVPKTFKFDEIKMHFVDDLTKYSIAAAIRALKDKKE